MFSTLQSFLPSALQNNSNTNHANSDNRPPPGIKLPSGEHEDRPPDARAMNADEMGTFIIVRPPPSKSNHPLNLQVQLVPPQHRERSATGGRSSLDSSAEPGVINLSRTSTNRSDTTSIYSSYSSAASLNSVATASSTSSGRRMIIPLYNLQAHNVMTNVVVDAGTDAKIARFLRRGLEVIGLAVLEPVEVFGPAGYTHTHAQQSSTTTSPARRSVDDAHRLSAYSRSGTPDPPHTPGSSHLSLTSTADSHGHLPPPPPPHSSLPPVAELSTPPPSTGPKKLFGKLFRSRKDSAPGPTPPSSPSPPTPTPYKRASLVLTSPTPPTSADPTPTSSAISNGGPGPGQPVLQPEILGIRPSLLAPTNPPVGRPSAYVWVVRRWLKGAPEGVLGGMIAQLDARRRERGPGGGGGEVELRFEWTKARQRASRASGRRRSVRRGGSEGGERRASVALSSQSSLHGGGEEAGATSAGAGGKTPRARAGGFARRSLDRGSLSTQEHEHEHDEGGEAAAERTPRPASGFAPREDDGEESDPEDSETPWMCYLVLRRVYPGLGLNLGSGSGSGGAGGGGGAGGTEEQVKTRVASLSPTPHHPKVVAMLKVPFPLPDVDVERMGVRPRVVTPAGVARPAVEEGGAAVGGAGGGAGGGGVVLTAEEIKDVVSATGMWVVVREGIGGVGKVARKGDGWRLRG
ncbi:hypothetical protein PUNSTDRAFT_47009 [Punctularia strigosozonata HHB-11173 SS5]|uniref:Uncharacterized protein n=1 Tax=Punctularia strigosozonata (strain HHB-11173) TaxID=741275 RepID=R7S464_PUNST|nr:uncharacterized protein PUNSTDRAFT_47009 [Punctularia strigosozonata HHB-11173 SS5]EIN05170.1 hypothetical protein PUNSTDRAFT_47009 [Punctularia strigosozonata HHB-11173 SS5]